MVPFVRCVSSLVLAGVCFAQGPPLSPILTLPGDDQIGAAAGQQDQPQVARGNGMLLAVWQDSRTDLTGNLLQDESGIDVYAARFDSSGRLVDATPIVVRHDAGDQTSPRVAWNGMHWLVVWVSQVPTQFYWTVEIQAARVSIDGTVLDLVPIVLHTDADSANSELWDVAAAGVEWGVFWKDFAGNGWQVRAVRVDADGSLRDPMPVDVLATPSQPYNGAVVFAADRYLVVWNHWVGDDLDDVFGQRVGANLAPIGAPFAIARDDDYDVWPAVATDGRDFFVAWENYNSCCVGGGGKTFAARVTAAGQVLDPTGILLSATNSVTIGRRPGAAFDGSNWLAVWSYEQLGGEQVHAARVSPSGVVLDPGGGFRVDPAQASQNQPVAAGLPGSGFLVLWTDWRPGRGETDVFAAPVAAGGVPGPASAVARGAPSQVAPDAVAVPGGWFVVYESRGSGTSRILGQRLDARGAPVDLVPIEIAPASVSVGQPAVAFDGTLHLVVWQDGARIVGRRVSLAGQVLDPQPIAILPGIDPDVAAQAGVFLVVDTHTPSNPQFRFPFAARVRAADGALLDPVPVQLGQYFAQRPAVAAIGERWIVAWQRHFSHDEVRANIHAALVDRSGVALPEFTVEAPFTRVLRDTAVTSDGTTALVAWNDATSPAAGPDIQGRLVRADGSLLGGVPISSAEKEQSRPALAWDGVRYLAAWQDRRNITFFVDDRKDVFGARIAANGAVLDPAGFALFDRPRPEIQPALAGSNGAALVAAALFDETQPRTAYRIGLRLVNPPSCPGLAVPYGTGCPGAGGHVPQLLVEGCPTSASVITFDLRAALGGSVAALAFGTQRTAVNLPGGCQLLVSPILATVAPLQLSPGRLGGGTLRLPLLLPPGMPPATATMQAFVLDFGVAHGFAATNGVEITIR